MGTVLSLTVGLIIWIVLWAMGIKAFDGFLITMAMGLAAVAGRLVIPHLPGNRESD